MICCLSIISKEASFIISFSVLFAYTQFVCGVKSAICRRPSTLSMTTIFSFFPFYFYFFILPCRTIRFSTVLPLKKKKKSEAIH